jgi:hypothetical protein
MLHEWDVNLLVFGTQYINGMWAGCSWGDIPKSITVPRLAGEIFKGSLRPLAMTYIIPIGVNIFRDMMDIQWNIIHCKWRFKREHYHITYIYK